MHPKLKLRLIQLLAIIVVTIASCKQNRLEGEKQRFIDYLQTQYQEKPPEEKHFYILSNSYVCRGCVTKHLIIIDSLASIIPHGITIITTQQFKQLEASHKNVRIKFDREKTLDRENLNLNNLTIYTTERGTVVGISHFGINQEQELVKTLTTNP